MRIIYLFALVVAIALISLGCTKKVYSNTEGLIQKHENLALHIHPFLEIVINDEKIIIPDNVGRSDAGMHYIHTHDETGKLHVEAPDPRLFTLNDFFIIWNKQFNESCILEYCSNESAQWMVSINDSEVKNHDQLVLRAGDRIKLEYTSKLASQ